MDLLDFDSVLLARFCADENVEDDASEELVVMWAVAEADLTTLVNDGFVPASSMQSAGRSRVCLAGCTIRLNV